MYKFKLNQSDRCRSTLDQLVDQAGRPNSPSKGWLAAHISRCPRCQARLKGYGRVSLGLSLLNSQRHSIDLLARANRQTLRYLNHNIRQTANALELSRVMPQPHFWSRLHRFGQTCANTAACLTMLFILKTGIFNSITRSGREGDETIKGYYAKNLDKDSQAFHDLFQC